MTTTLRRPFSFRLNPRSRQCALTWGVFRYRRKSSRRQWPRYSSVPSGRLLGQLPDRQDPDLMRRGGMPRTVTAGMGETSEHESILKQKFGAGDREAHQFVSRKLRGGSQLALPKMTTATAAKRTRRFILHLIPGDPAPNRSSMPQRLPLVRRGYRRKTGTTLRQP